LFIHTHSHSFYSISDGMFSPKKWAEELKRRGFKAHCLTDHGTMSGLFAFNDAMKENGLTPLFGVEFYFNDDPENKDPSNTSVAHIVLIAKNLIGWKNLLTLSYLSYTKGYYYRPRIGPKWLKEYSKGLICTTACIGGILAREIWNEVNKVPTMGLKERYHQLWNIFNSDLYVEFQGHRAKEQQLCNLLYQERLPRFQPLVTNDCHYLSPEHAKIQHMLKTIAFHRKEKAESFSEFDSLWLMNAKEVFSMFKQYHKKLKENDIVLRGMKNTEDIFNKCKDFEIPKGKYLPTFECKMGAKDYFKKLTKDALVSFLATADRKGKLHASQSEYVKRFVKEFGIITKYNLQDYFLVVLDIVNFAKRMEFMSVLAVVRRRVL
jgi:DNA polymerase III subunit alpha